MKPHTYYLSAFCQISLPTILAFFAPIWGLLILVGSILIFDTTYAVYSVVKLSGWGKFTSNKLFNVAVKAFFYLGSIMLAYQVDVHIISNNTLFGIELLIAKFTTVFWVFIEVKSIDETSVKLGNRSFSIVIKEMLGCLKSLKKDISELKK